MDGPVQPLPTDALDAATLDASHPDIPAAPSAGPPTMFAAAPAMGQLPTTNTGSMPEGSQVAPSPEMQSFVGKEVQYGSVPQQIATGLEGAANAATFGLSAGIEKAMGIPDADVLARRQVNPNAYLAGQIAGLAATNLIPGVGEANDARMGLTVATMAEDVAKGTAAAEQAAQGLKIAREVAQNSLNPFSAASIMSTAGKNVAGILGLGKEGAGFLNQIGAHTVQGAVEMALLQGGDEISKAIINDPEQSVDTALSNIGMAAAMGALGGGMIGSVSPLLKAVSTSNIGQELANFIERGNERLHNVDPITGFNDEMSNIINDYDRVADGIYGDNGLKGQAIQQHIPELNDNMFKQYQEIANRVNGQIDTTLKGDPLAKKLSGLMDIVQDQVNKAQTSAQVFDAMEFAKRRLQELSSFTYKGSIPVMERDFVKVATEAAHDFRTALEDTNTWGKAGQVQQDLNSAYAKSLSFRKDIKRRFMQSVGGVEQYNPAAGETYINQIGSNKAVIKQDVIEKFINSYDDLKSAVNKTYDSIGLTNPYESILPRNQIQWSLKELTPGAKLFDALIRHNLSNMAGRSMGAAVGWAAGHETGLPGASWIGSWLGKSILGPFFSTILPVLTKPILSKAINAESFMAASEFGSNIVRGKQLLDKGAKAIFNAGLRVGATIPADKHLDKFDKKLRELQLNPEKMSEVGGQINHYLPDHGITIAQSVSNAANYLNSIRPLEVKQNPLDTVMANDPVTEAKYRNALAIAASPAIILHRLKEGTLTQEDVNHLNNLYPGLTRSLQMKLTSELANHINKGGIVPYKTRIGLSMLLNKPLDSTMSQPGLFSIQNTFMRPTPQQAPQQGLIRQKSQGSLKNINKLAEGVMTSSQARSAAREQIVK